MNSSFQKLRLIYFLGSFFLLLYLTARSILVPFVYDEAATFFIYILPGEFIPFNSYWDANNHLLNSFLGIVSSYFFGNSEWALRLPNVLFFIFSIVFLFQLHKFFENKIVWFCMALSILFSHNLIEYSAYCRGYGMAISSLIASVYFLLEFLRHSNTRSLIGFNLFSFLALAANFTLLNVMLIASVTLIMRSIYERKFAVNIIAGLLLNVIFIALTVWIATELKKRGLLYYGSQEGFYKVTLTSLSNLIYGSTTKTLPVVFIVLSLLACIVCIVKFKKFQLKNAISKPATIAAFLFFGSMLVVISLNLLLNVNYPEDRTALYLYPLFILFLFFSIDLFSVKKIAKTSAAVILFLVATHFFTQTNFAYSTYWRQERVPETFYSHIADEWKGREHEVFISAYRMKGYIWNYYTFRNKQKLNEIYHQNFPSPKADYMIIEENNYNKYPGVVKNYTEVFFDKHNHIRLLKNRGTLNYQLFFDSVVTEPKTIIYPYVDLLDLKIYNDSIQNAASEFECELSTDKLSYIDFVFKAMKGNETLSEAVCRIQWQREKWINPDNKIKNRIFLENVTSADRYVLFINGREGESYKLSNLKIKVFSF